MINLIAATGLSGQLGLRNRLPWEDDLSLRGLVIDDLKWFRKVTDAGVLLVGGRTFKSMQANGFMPETREVIIWTGEQKEAGEFLKWVVETRHKREIWVCGGAHTYRCFLPWVQRFHISRIPYNGPADTWMTNNYEFHHGESL
jgi:dihydrofolate reductase